MSKQKSKLDQINVPDKLYQYFMKDIPRGQSALVDRLHDTVPTNHGRGQTRILKELTHAEWDELYSLAADARSHMTGSDRETTLRGAICGKALAERMESLGVSNPVTYTPKRSKGKRKAQKTEEPEATTEDDAVSSEAEGDEVTSEEEDTNLNSTVHVPTEPMTIPTADDLEETGEDEQQNFMDDMNFGS